MVNMYHGADKNVFRKAFMRRKCETPAEKLLWRYLRNSQLDGFKFRRQHPVADFIADFYCHKAKLVVEVDEKYHDRPEQAFNDKVRTSVMNRHGLKVLRFRDEEVFREIDQVLHIIREHLK